MMTVNIQIYTKRDDCCASETNVYQSAGIGYHSDHNSHSSVCLLLPYPSCFSSTFALCKSTSYESIVLTSWMTYYWDGTLPTNE